MCAYRFAGSKRSLFYDHHNNNRHVIDHPTQMADLVGVF